MMRVMLADLQSAASLSSFSMSDAGDLESPGDCFPNLINKWKAGMMR